MSAHVVHRRLVRPVLALLTQGVTPEKIAFTLALGLVLGVFPVLGSTTILCGVAAAVFGLNLPVIQLANWVAYPLQLLSLVPLIRLGEILFRAKPLPFTLQQMLTMSRDGLAHAVAILWLAAAQAIAAWLLLCPLGLVVAYGIFLVGIRIVTRRRWSAEPASNLS
jgi:uncharacterized protein (DUF2062 family)